MSHQVKKTPKLVMTLEILLTQRIGWFISKRFKGLKDGTFGFIVICFALRQQYFKIECFDAALDDLFEEISGQPSQARPSSKVCL